MKTILAAVFIATAPALALAQASPAAKPASASAAKPATAAKPANAKLAPSARKAVEENTPIDDDSTINLSDAAIEMARKVYVGDIACELGTSVKVTPMKREGMFAVTTKGHRFRMHPVESRTGAIRLEDPKLGAMWLQLGNKSMLMSQKLGQRLADECQSPEQLTYAETLKKNPPPSILESTSSSPGSTGKSGPN